uniref:Uncharacterized protein n=1 Tax=Glossina austeni TaxID=7395 RepID=A0A1A9V003_GLOAU
MYCKIFHVVVHAAAANWPEIITATETTAHAATIIAKITEVTKIAEISGIIIAIIAKITKVAKIVTKITVITTETTIKTATAATATATAVSRITKISARVTVTEIASVGEITEISAITKITATAEISKVTRISEITAITEREEVAKLKKIEQSNMSLTSTWTCSATVAKITANAAGTITATLSEIIRRHTSKIAITRRSFHFSQRTAEYLNIPEWKYKTKNNSIRSVHIGATCVDNLKHTSFAKSKRWLDHNK